MLAMWTSLGHDFGVLQQRHLLVERLGSEFAPHGEPVEGHLRAPGPVGAELTRVGLTVHAATIVGGLLCVVEQAPPSLGVGAAAGERREEHRAAGLDREVAEAAFVVIGVVGVLAHGRLAADLDQPAIDLAHRQHQRANLIPSGEAGGHGQALASLVRGRAGGGEAHRAVRDGLGEDVGHFGDFLVAGLVGEGRARASRRCGGRCVRRSRRS